MCSLSSLPQITTTTTRPHTMSYFDFPYRPPPPAPISRPSTPISAPPTVSFDTPRTPPGTPTMSYAPDRRPLQIAVPPRDAPVQKSRFSPVSPQDTAASGSSAMPLRAKGRGQSRDLEAGLRGAGADSNGSRSPRVPLREKVARAWFDLRYSAAASRSSKGKEPELPMQHPPWAPKPLYTVHKQQQSYDNSYTDRRHISVHNEYLNPAEKKRARRKRWVWRIIVIIICLLILGDLAFVNVRVVQKSFFSSSTSTSSGTSSSSTSPSTLSAAAQQCLSQFTVDAPSNPSSYPCSTCLSSLQSVPLNFSISSPQDAQQVQNAVQFCGLKSLFDDADNAGQTCFTNWGWLKDTGFCGWQQVNCDSYGRVSSL